VHKVVLIIFTMIVLIVAGVKIHHAVSNTSDNAAASFVQGLAKGNVEKTRAYLTPELLQDREEYWDKYLRDYEQDEKPTFIAHEYIMDPFNTYGDGEMPERFIYAFQKGSKTHNMTIIMVRHDKRWLVDELFSEETN
jgi:hypothetical protein